MLIMNMEHEHGEHVNSSVYLLDRNCSMSPVTILVFSFCFAKFHTSGHTRRYAGCENHSPDLTWIFTCALETYLLHKGILAVTLTLGGLFLAAPKPLLTKSIILYKYCT